MAQHLSQLAHLKSSLTDQQEMLESKDLALQDTADALKEKTAHVTTLEATIRYV